MTSRLYCLAAVAVVVAACAEPPVTPQVTLGGGRRIASIDGAKSYVIQTTGNSIPSGFSVSVGAAGGTVTASLDKIGVAIVSSSDPQFAAKASAIKGVVSVDEDVVLEFTHPLVGADESVAADAPATTTSTAVGANETFRDVQWAPDAVSAPAAWAAGYQGAGARVAVIDGGIDANHVDVAANLDVAHSASFVPGFAFNQDTPGFHHATHVAGIIAAPNNGIGIIGIAPQATIIAVKALQGGSGSFGAVINAIYYAATPIAENGGGADIINMSLGALFPSNGASHLLNALSRATSYANQRGVTVIASAGNDATDFDHTANLVDVPAMSVGVIAVAATGPTGWGANPAANLDAHASYSNYGQSVISLAGPGGDNQLFGTVAGNAICSRPRHPSGSVVQRCWVWDMVISGSGGTTGYSWADGTSMAAPAVAGVAALIKGKNPGITREQLEAKLRSSADDLGKPGNDDFYGAGRVNAFRAIQ